jgi:tRNA(Ile)-lysidine synthase
MIEPGARVLVAVSGGPDSVCLLHVLHELAPALGFTLSGVAHVNHKLRGPDSDQDQCFVAAVASSLGLKLHRIEAAVGGGAGNLEQAGRLARNEFFTGLIRAGAGDRVALGHTRDDQAETVLFRVLRGAGLAGLAGVLPVTADGLVRPLLAVTREETAGFLRARGIAWREDLTNREPRFARNRIRNELLPQLARDWNPRLRDALANLAALAYDEEQWWARRIARIAARTLAPARGGIELRALDVTKLSPAVARRLIRHAIRNVKGDLRRVEYPHVEGVLDLAGRKAGHGRLSLPGLRVLRSFEWLRLEPLGPATLPEPQRLPAPGSCRSPDGNTLISLEVIDRKQIAGPCATLRRELALPEALRHFEVRGWRPGDHYRPVGEANDRKLKDMFQRGRVPSWRRPFWPILTDGRHILWAREFGVAAEFAAGDKPGLVLRICETEADPGRKSLQDESFGAISTS